MDWGTIANLILELGLPATEKLISLWQNNEQVTLAEFQALTAQANQTAQDRMKLRIVAAGITLDSPQAQILLGLTGAPPNLSPPAPTQPPA